MNLDPLSLAKIEEKYPGYLEGKIIHDFFEEFGIRFAAGHWVAGDFKDRFAPSGYRSNEPSFDDSIIAQMQRVSEAGVQGIEFHDSALIDENYNIIPERVSQVKDALNKYNLTPTNMNTNLWTDPKWKLGGVTNVNPSIREDAIKVAFQSVKLAKEIGCSSVALWPGSDGWDYNFEVNYGKQLDMFIDACVEINKEAKKNGLVFGTEAKLYEPREGCMVVSTTDKAILVAKEVNTICGGANMGVAIDYGHVQMYGGEPAECVYTAKRLGVPISNFHINNSKYKSNDEDRITGTGDNWRFADFLYAAVDTGYDGWFGEDQFTYRTDQVKSIVLSMEMFATLMKKVLIIYRDRDKLEAAQVTGDAAKTIDVVKRYLV